MSLQLSLSGFDPDQQKVLSAMGRSTMQLSDIIWFSRLSVDRAAAAVDALVATGKVRRDQWGACRVSNPNGVWENEDMTELLRAALTG